MTWVLNREFLNSFWAAAGWATARDIRCWGHSKLWSVFLFPTADAFSPNDTAALKVASSGSEDSLILRNL